MNLEKQFERIFGRSPSIRVEAPGRINLIGEHIDYLDGCVMPAAINRRLKMLAAPCDGESIRVWSAQGAPEPQIILLDDLNPRTAANERWLNYLIGVIAGYRETGVEIPGFEAAIFSDLPAGAGLSSSAALETATALTIEAFTGISVDAVDRALLCQKAEHEFAGVPCGIMDQLAVGASQREHALMIDCRDLTLTPVRIPDEVAMVVADTQVKHALSDGEYRKRREDCEEAREMLGVSSLRDATLGQVESAEEILGDRLFRRARHVVTEMARVQGFADALAAGDQDRIGMLMRAGHDSLRDDFEVSCDELDTLVDEAYEFGPERGLIGSRMTGGGFGGSTVSLVREDAADALAKHLEIAFSEKFDHSPVVFKTAAADGAKIGD